MAGTLGDEQDVRNLEENKCAGWDGYTLEDLERANEQGKLFGPLKKWVEEASGRFVEAIRASNK